MIIWYSADIQAQNNDLLIVILFKKPQTDDHMIFRYSSGWERDVQDLYCLVLNRHGNRIFTIVNGEDIAHTDLFQKIRILLDKQPQSGIRKIPQFDLIFPYPSRGLNEMLAPSEAGFRIFERDSVFNLS